ncbi:hypothetical protein M8C21_007957 [Ambrosia artemisiifolia]|uniref:Uncharacterized protein n=1 Tax=Ambrosia artemisiifolia TaxID=4212 RepID=A0AAD5CS37_AMBAR|nr:hypothetical protein M8C21_007957 [Ambrosia artemisiifolia]
MYMIVSGLLAQKHQLRIRVVSPKLRVIVYLKKCQHYMFV